MDVPDSVIRFPGCSGMLFAIDRNRVRDQSEYASIQNYLAQSPCVLKKEGDKYPDCEDLHD